MSSPARGAGRARTARGRRSPPSPEPPAPTAGGSGDSGATGASGAWPRRGGGLEQLAAAPLPIRKAFDRKLNLLVRDLRHPSLRAKKYDVTRRRVFRRPLTAGEAWSFVDAVLASPALGILVPG